MMGTELELSWVYQNAVQNFSMLQQQLHPSAHWQLEQEKCHKELEVLQEAIAIYHCYFENFYESRDRFWVGYRLGLQCCSFLHDAAHVPVRAIRMALNLSLQQAALSPYFLGIQIGWRLSNLQKKLKSHLADSEGYKTVNSDMSLAVTQI
ncbi:MAG: hypothetical protein SAJ72_13845 [Jaaginema sp. PMC 1080.18]|nr:hypothetical protein [Jaaginema sp. PMC 1080.18]MEC4867423.1 hypothetical protein [Jaaginema sp. PMC 1078.18]